MPKSNYNTNLDKVDFFKRAKAYKSLLEILRENIIDTIQMKDHKTDPKTFEEIAVELGLSSKSAAYLIYKANKSNFKKIKDFIIK